MLIDLLLLIDRIWRDVQEWRCEQQGHRWLVAPSMMFRICWRCDARQVKRHDEGPA